MSTPYKDTLDRLIKKSIEGLEGRPVSPSAGKAIVRNFVKALSDFLIEANDLTKDGNNTFSLRGLGTFFLKPRRRNNTVQKVLRFKAAMSLNDAFKKQAGEFIYDESDLPAPMKEVDGNA